MRVGAVTGPIDRRHARHHGLLEARARVHAARGTAALLAHRVYLELQSKLSRVFSQIE